MTLLIQDAQKREGSATAQGLHKMQYQWGRMEDGKWARAFRHNNDQPIAIPLHGNVFGEAAYVGNHMHEA